MKFAPRHLAVFIVICGLGLLLYSRKEPFEYNLSRSRCESRLQQLALAANIYRRDYDERSPLAENWSESLAPYVKDTTLFDCPEAGIGYAFNSRLSGLSFDQLHSLDIAEFFDSTTETLNASDAGQSWPELGAHWRSIRGNNVAFVAGYVRFMSDKPDFENKPPLPSVPFWSWPDPSESQPKQQNQ